SIKPTNPQTALLSGLAICEVTHVGACTSLIAWNNCCSQPGMVRWYAKKVDTTSSMNPLISKLRYHVRWVGNSSTSGGSNSLGACFGAGLFVLAGLISLQYISFLGVQRLTRRN